MVVATGQLLPLLCIIAREGTRSGRPLLLVPIELSRVPTDPFVSRLFPISSPPPFVFRPPRFLRRRYFFVTIVVVVVVSSYFIPLLVDGL